MSGATATVTASGSGRRSAPHSPVRSRSWYRCRDLAAIGVVLLIGISMINTVYTRGAGDSVAIALRAFTVGIAVLLTAYGAGMVIDRLAQRYPVLVRPRSSRAFVALTGLATATYALFVFRESILETVMSLLA